ncbi:RdgB/HAM1 family non-canonical purine NTP pyrophosphatase [Candidatus Fermentibacteria bacterium]|nr:RdgB/HAM1 family non-canonical purine NTP pyrophosphatase [Candidatus Fermentibacteria bacterium]
MRLVIATANRDKRLELMALLDGLGIDLLPMTRWKDLVSPAETGRTLEENATIKALSAARHTGLPAVADDTGLEVEALNGRPGVFAARFAGEGATYRDNRERLLREMLGIPEDRRGAAFRTVAALCFPDGECFTVEGKCIGRITGEERGDGGFGYDSIFLIPSLGVTFAEMTTDQKNAISHRSQALGKMRELITEHIVQGQTAT